MRRAYFTDKSGDSYLDTLCAAGVAYATPKNFLVRRKISKAEADRIRALIEQAEVAEQTGMKQTEMKQTEQAGEEKP